MHKPLSNSLLTASRLLSHSFIDTLFNVNNNKNINCNNKEW